MNFEQYNGTTVIAKKYEAKIESTTPSAIGVKMYLLTPEKKVTGKKTMDVVNVAARTAIETSMPPISDATAGVSPISMWRKMFSRTLTPLLISLVLMSRSPPRIMVLIDPPVYFVISRHTTIDNGTERITAIIARGLPRKIRIMIPVSTSPMNASFDTFAMAV